MKVSSIVRPTLTVPLENFTEEFDSTVHTLGMEWETTTQVSESLLVTLDVYEDGSVVTNRCIRFTDFPGLSSEWADGTNTTILTSALQAVVDSVSDKTLEYDSTTTETLNSYQRSQVISQSLTRS